ncbi:MAG TPA: cation diffusion facilitator family transporter [Dissulfurispiraceae bacterium]|nr:cation diffusion facilitator family transporter [Dissulfurispiraceae bacterium]
MERNKEVRKVLIITLLLNVAVAAAKIVYGFSTDSVAITSDGFHSMFDGVSNIAGLIAVHIAAHPPDARHPYGHRKYETVFTIFIGVLMLFTCFEILKQAWASFHGEQRAVIGATSFVVMFVTLAVNIFVATYEKRMGTKLKSDFLIADSQHTRSDIYVTLGVIVSLPFALLGYAFVDPLVGVVVGVMVARIGVIIIRDSANALADSRAGCPVVIQDVCRSVEGVVDCHKIRTRGTAGSVFVDLHIQVTPGMSINDAHEIAHRVEKSIKAVMPDVVDVVVHIEPHKSSDTTVS